MGNFLLKCPQFFCFISGPLIRPCYSQLDPLSHQHRLQISPPLTSLEKINSYATRGRPRSAEVSHGRKGAPAVKAQQAEKAQQRRRSREGKSMLVAVLISVSCRINNRTDRNIAGWIREWISRLIWHRGVQIWHLKAETITLGARGYPRWDIGVFGFGSAVLPIWAIGSDSLTLLYKHHLVNVEKRRANYSCRFLYFI